jgi:predicted HTH domain antitoxin
MSELAVPFPEDILKTVHRTADEFAADVRLASAVEWYRRGLVSQGRGAEIAGLCRAEFIDALSARKVDVIQFDPADLDDEVRRAR